MPRPSVERARVACVHEYECVLIISSSFDVRSMSRFSFRFVSRTKNWPKGPQCEKNMPTIWATSSHHDVWPSSHTARASKNNALIFALSPLIRFVFSPFYSYFRFIVVTERIFKNSNTRMHMNNHGGRKDLLWLKLIRSIYVCARTSVRRISRQHRAGARAACMYPHNKWINRQILVFKFKYNRHYFARSLSCGHLPRYIMPNVCCVHTETDISIRRERETRIHTWNLHACLSLTTIYFISVN